MVLTAAQTATFFRDNQNGMALADATVTALDAEGISSVSDLQEFDKDLIQQIASNFRIKR